MPPKPPLTCSVRPAAPPAPGRPVLARPGYHRRNPSTLGPRPIGTGGVGRRNGAGTRGRAHGVGGLQRFEQRLEQFVSGAFARAFRSAVQPVEISAALQRECDNNAQILSRQRRMVPNDFQVELSQADMDRLAPYDSALVKELTAQLTEHAEKQSYVFSGPVTIGFEAADDLTIGRFRVRSPAHASVTSNATPTQVRRARADVRGNGTPP